MEHFSEWSWADFVREISNSERREMEAHLANRCSDCAAERDIWKQVYAVALRESNYAPPEAAVRMVGFEFTAQSLQKGKQPALANLVLDTLTRPSLAGVRSSAAAARQMVYEADGFTVDLRFDRLPHSETISLIGQVLDTRPPRGPLGDAAVILWTDRGLPVGETQTNRFGEFNLDFDRI
jgi:hypothetical protein